MYYCMTRPPCPRVSCRPDPDVQVAARGPHRPPGGVPLQGLRGHGGVTLSSSLDTPLPLGQALVVNIKQHCTIQDMCVSTPRGEHTRTVEPRRRLPQNREEKEA